MNKHWKYLKYLLRHKYYVYKAGRKLGVGFWQLIVHDWSKFLPSEWFPYANYFYGEYPGFEEMPLGELLEYKGKFKEEIEKEFDVAWLKHQHRSPHHYQHWVLLEDSGKVKYLDIPDKYLKEMVADWTGAGMAIHGKDETKEWFLKNSNKIKLFDRNLFRVLELLGIKNGEEAIS